MVSTGPEAVSGNKASSPVVLVTGASSGIGEAIARRFARGGYCVAMAARRLDRLEALATEIAGNGGQALPVQADVGRLEDIQHMVASTIERFGGIDVLVNNAGFGRLGWLEELDPVKDIQAQLQVNLLGVIWATQAALPHMIARRSGHIINIASMAGYVATPTYTIYAATKYGVRGFSEALRREVSLYNIHVSGVFPGGVATEFGSHANIQRKTNVTTPGWLKLSAEQVAESVWRLARHPRRGAILPGVMWLSAALNTLFPGVIDWSTEQLFVKKERT